MSIDATRALEKKLARRRARRDRNMRTFDSDVMLSLGPLMDVVTIILVYFINNFVISPISVQDPAVDLPMSSSQEKVEEAVVVMITGPIRQEAGRKGVKEIKNIPSIIVDDKAILQLDPDSYRVPDNYKKRGYVIWPLKDALEQVKQKQIQTAKLTDEAGFDGKVAIIADKATPYRVLTDVLVTCGEAGFGKFKFTIAKERPQ